MTNEYWQRMTVALTYLAQKRGKNTAHRFSQSLYANFIPTYSASTVDRSTWGNIERGHPLYWYFACSFNLWRSAAIPKTATSFSGLKHDSEAPPTISSRCFMNAVGGFSAQLSDHWPKLRHSPVFQCCSCLTKTRSSLWRLIQQHDFPNHCLSICIKKKKKLIGLSQGVEPWSELLRRHFQLPSMPACRSPVNKSSERWVCWYC